MKMTAGATWEATANRARTCGGGGVRAAAVQRRGAQLLELLVRRQAPGSPGSAPQLRSPNPAATLAASPTTPTTHTHAHPPTSFSPSPIHLETREEAEMEKNTARMLVAMALPSIVLPVPGGPKSRMPLGGVRAPCGVGSRARVGGGRRGYECAS